MASEVPNAAQIDPVPHADPDTHADPAAPADPVLVDEGYEAESNDGDGSETIYATTISSYIREGIEENGRKYAAYGKHAYGLPVDEREQERNDLQHAKFTALIHDRLHLAPLPSSPTAILDLGTGSGIWAIDMADAYETATVTGVDVAPVQATWVPPNCVFEVLDIEDEWLFKPASFDFIHARELIMSIRNWEGLFAQALAHLKPGGWFEVGGSYPRPRSDDGSLAEGASLVEISDLFFQMGEKMGTPMDAPLRWREQMEAVGFVDVQETVFVIPQGPWPKDKRLKKVGAFEHHSLMMGFEAYLMRGYTAILGGKPEELTVMLAQTRKELGDPGVHSYIPYYKVIGRRPEEKSEAA